MKKKQARAKPGKTAPLVGVIMGSDTDLPVMSEAIKTLKEFGLPYEVEVTSAHRSPDRTHHYAKTALERGLKVIIVGAGGASHLAGVVAAETTLPVIAVPVVATPPARPGEGGGTARGRPPPPFMRRKLSRPPPPAWPSASAASRASSPARWKK